MIGVGVIGCGSVFWGPYLSMLERLAVERRVAVRAVYDRNPGKREAAARRTGTRDDLSGPEAVMEAAGVDVVLVLTSMNEHAALTRLALAAGKHVLVEKPVATSLEDARAILDTAATAPGHLVCAPHILLSPTYRAMHARVRAGDIGEVLLARARYGWARP